MKQIDSFYERKVPNVAASRGSVRQFSENRFYLRTSRFACRWVGGMPRSSRWREKRYLKRLLRVAILSRNPRAIVLILARLRSVCRSLPRVTCDPRAKLNLHCFDRGAFYSFFRLHNLEDLLRLSDALGVPDTYETRHGYRLAVLLVCLLSLPAWL